MIADESLGGGLPRHSCVPSHMGAVSSERLGTGWRPPLSYQCSTVVTTMGYQLPTTGMCFVPCWVLTRSCPHLPVTPARAGVPSLGSWEGWNLPGPHTSEGAAETRSRAGALELELWTPWLSASGPGRLSRLGRQLLEVKFGFSAAAKRGRHCRGGPEAGTEYGAVRPMVMCSWFYCSEDRLISGGNSRCFLF